MNEQTKHTPGPWKAVRNASYWEIEPANAGQDGIPFNVGDVCASAPGAPDSGLQEANARLIAAAPDLLEALEGLLEAGTLNVDKDGFVTFSGNLREYSDFHAACRAAIAKATGK